MDLTAFEKQLIDVTAIWALTYRTHYHIYAFMTVVPNVLPEPSSSAWWRVHAGVAIGMTIEEALRNLWDEVPTPGIGLLVEMYEKGERNLQLDALDETLQVLWERYDPNTKPENSSFETLIALTEHLKYGDVSEHEEAIRRFLTMGDRAIPYLIDHETLSTERLPTTINLLKVLGTEGAIINLKRIARIWDIKPGHGAILKTALDEFGLGYTPTVVTAMLCKACGQSSVDVAGAYCWVCNGFVCDEHVVRTDRNRHATFCSQQHLDEANKYLGYWM